MVQAQAGAARTARNNNTIDVDCRKNNEKSYILSLMRDQTRHDARTQKKKKRKRREGKNELFYIYDEHLKFLYSEQQ